MGGFDLYYIFYSFTAYAFIGWCLESVYAAYLSKKFINRGFLNGPFCPVYGFGAVLLIIALYPLRQNPFLLFICSIILTSVLEYITGFILEKAFNSTWWSYSNRRFNIKGRICLQFSLLWGAASVILVYILHPNIYRLIAAIPRDVGNTAAYFILAYLLTDTTVAVLSAADLHARVGQLHNVSIELKFKLEHIREVTSGRAEDMETKLQELRARYEYLLHKRVFGHSRLLTAFPALKSKKFGNIMTDIRSALNQRLVRK